MFSTDRHRTVIKSIAILLFVYFVFAIYVAALRFTSLNEAIGIEKKDILDLFEKTFGLAAGIVIAMVAIVLAEAALELGKAQNAIGERQTRLELESQLIQISLSSPEIAREAVSRASEVVKEVDFMFQSVSRMTAEIQRSRAELHEAVRPNVLDDDTVAELKRRLSTRTQEACHKEALGILKSSKRLVGFIGRHSDQAEKCAAMNRHFGNLLEILQIELKRRADYLRRDGDLQAEWLERVLNPAEPGRRQVAVLGFLTSAPLEDYVYFDPETLSDEYQYDSAPVICEDLQLDIATGRYINLAAALEEMAKNFPPYKGPFCDDPEEFEVQFITPLVATALDLVNPYRLLPKVEGKLNDLHAIGGGGNLRIKDATIDAIAGYINDHMPYAHLIFDRNPVDSSTDHGKFFRVHWTFDRIPMGSSTDYAKFSRIRWTPDGKAFWEPVEIRSL